MKTLHEDDNKLLNVLHSSKLVGGFTHNYYRYPARMLPELAREVIFRFSKQDDIVFDPFMGGGTSIVEAIASGRRAIGIDINSLSQYITDVKTTPLSPRDQACIIQWANEIDFSHSSHKLNNLEDNPKVKNISAQAQLIFESIIDEVDRLPLPRQRRFARCCLLRLGQWAIDGKTFSPNCSLLKEKFLLFVQEMFQGLEELVYSANNHGIAKNKLRNKRILLHRSTLGAEEDNRLLSIIGKPTLVVTSPPYPGVHVLYHRWQVAGRRETPAPYWFIGTNDGQGASYYTLGGRSEYGLDQYFRSISEIYQSVKKIIHPDALIVQLVSFLDVNKHLSAFLQAMEQAGFSEVMPITTSRTNLWRSVPNRKWYNRINAARGTGKEILLFHKQKTP